MLRKRRISGAFYRFKQVFACKSAGIVLFAAFTARVQFAAPAVNGRGVAAAGAVSDVFTGGLLDLVCRIATLWLGAHSFAGSFPGRTVAGFLAGDGVRHFV